MRFHTQGAQPGLAHSLRRPSSPIPLAWCLPCLDLAPAEWRPSRLSSFHSSIVAKQLPCERMRCRPKETLGLSYQSVMTDESLRLAPLIDMWTFFLQRKKTKRVGGRIALIIWELGLQCMTLPAPDETSSPHDAFDVIMRRWRAGFRLCHHTHWVWCQLSGWW